MDGWWLGGGILGKLLNAGKFRAATNIYQPANMEERQSAAQRCSLELNYGIDTYIDNMDDSVNEAYAAMPTRLYLIGENGKVAYAGGLGPFGFKPAELEKAILQYLFGSRVASQTKIQD